MSKSDFIKKVIKEVSEGFKKTSEGVGRVITGKVGKDLLEEQADISARLEGKLQQPFDEESFARVEQRFTAIEKTPVLSEEVFSGVRKNVNQIVGDFDANIKNSINESNINKLTEIVQSAGIDKVELQKAFDTNDFSGLRNNIKSKARENEFEKLSFLEMNVVKDWAPEEKINKIIGSTMDAEQKLANLTRLKIAGYQVNKEMASLEPKSLFSKTYDLFTNVTSKTGVVYRQARKLKLNALAESSNKFYDFLDSANKIEAKSNRVLTQLERALIEAGDDQSQLVNRYIENFAPERLAEDANGLFKDSVIQQQLGITDDMIRLANKKVNVYGQVMETKVQMDNNNFTASKISRDFEEVNELMPRTERMGAGDLGPNYTHAVPTKEYFMENIAKHDEFAALSKEHADNAYEMASFHAKARLGEISNLRLNPENRLKPHEEVAHYKRQFAPYMIKVNGNRLMNQIKAVGAFELGVRGTKKIAGPLNDLLAPMVKQWELKVNPKKLEDLSPTEKFLKGYVDTSVSFALANPLMWMFNSGQLITTGSNFKGLWNTISNTGIAQTKFVKEVVRNKGNVKKAMNAMFTDGIHPERKAFFERFYDESPEIQTILEPFAFDDTSKYKKWLDVINMLFAASDKISRYASFSSALDFGEKAIERFAKDVQTLGKAEAIKKVYKDAHLYEFDPIVRERLIEQLLDKNGKEFLYEFARQSVKAEIFDYSKIGSPFVKDWARNAHPIIAQTFTFTSWPMFYSQLMKGSMQALANGDRKPMTMLGLMGLGWYSAAQFAADSDINAVRMAGKYAIGRTPGLMPMVQLNEFFYKEPLGILAPIGKLPTAPILAGMKWMDDAMAGSKSGQTSVDFMYRDLKDTIKGNILLNSGKRSYNQVKALYDDFEQLFGDAF